MKITGWISWDATFLFPTQVQFAIMTYRLDISFSANSELPKFDEQQKHKEVTKKNFENEEDGPQNLDDNIGAGKEDDNSP